MGQKVGYVLHTSTQWHYGTESGLGCYTVEQEVVYVIHCRARSGLRDTLSSKKWFTYYTVEQEVG